MNRVAGFFCKTRNAALKAYDTQDFSLQLRARFYLYVCLSLLLFLPVILAISLVNSLVNAPMAVVINYRVVYSIAVAFVAVLFVLSLLIRGYFKIAANALLLILTGAVWFVMIGPFQEVLNRLNTIVLVVALMSIIPFMDSKSGWTAFVYGVLNILILFVFMIFFRSELLLNRMEFVDYLADNTVAFLFIALSAFGIIRINNESLSKADKLKENVEAKNRELELANKELAVSENKLRRAEASLRKSEARISEALEVGGIVPYFIDYRSYEYTYIGETIYALMGYSAEEISPQIMRDSIVEEFFWSKDIAVSPTEARRQILTEGSHFDWRCDMKMRTASGSLVWVSDISIELKDDNGKAFAAIGILQNIHERKRMESQLKDRSQRIELLHDIDKKLLSSGSLEDTAVDALQRLRNLIPSERSSLILFNEEKDEALRVATSCDDAFSVNIPDCIAISDFGQEIFQDLKDGLLCCTDDIANYSKKPEFFHELHKLGIRSWMSVPLLSQKELLGSLILDRKGDSYSEEEEAIAWEVANQLATVVQQSRLQDSLEQELRERKKAQHDLLQRVQQLATINDISRVLSELHSLEELLEVTYGQVQRIVPADVFFVVFYDEETDMISYPLTYDNGQRYEDEPLPLKRSTWMQQVIKSAEPLRIHRSLEELQGSAENPLGDVKRKSASLLFIPLLAGTQVLGVLSVQSYRQNAYTDEYLDIMTIVGRHVSVAIDNSRLYTKMQQDLKRRKDAEDAVRLLNEELELRVQERTSQLEAANRELLRAEKMAALGNLVAGVAHEINTPVGVALTASSHLSDTIQELIEGNRDFEKFNIKSHLSQSMEVAELITRNLMRAADLVNSFKQVSADQTSEQRSEFALREYIQKVLLSLKPLTKKRPQIQITIHGENGILLDSYPGALSQIVTNMISNAFQHAFQTDDEGILDIQLKDDAANAYVTFKDNGKGISSHDLPKIFDPFYTTQRAKGGVGLGLNIVYNLVSTKLGGSIECQSIEGEGAVFSITLPKIAPSLPLLAN